VEKSKQDKRLNKSERLDLSTSFRDSFYNLRKTSQNFMNHFSSVYEQKEPVEVKTHFKPFFTPLHRTHNFFKFTEVNLKHERLGSRYY